MFIFNVLIIPIKDISNGIHLSIELWTQEIVISSPDL